MAYRCRVSGNDIFKEKKTSNKLWQYNGVLLAASIVASAQERMKSILYQRFNIRRW